MHGCTPVYSFQAGIVSETIATWCYSAPQVTRYDSDNDCLKSRSVTSSVFSFCPLFTPPGIWLSAMGQSIMLSHNHLLTINVIDFYIIMLNVDGTEMLLLWTTLWACQIILSARQIHYQLSLTLYTLW